MKTKYLFVTSLAAILLCGCESKAERTVNELKALTEQYIKDLDKAQTKEEAIKIMEEYKERTEFEVNKLSDEEKKEYEKEISWEEAQEAKKMKARIDDAINRAKERFRNQ